MIPAVSFMRYAMISCLVSIFIAFFVFVMDGRADDGGGDARMTIASAVEKALKDNHEIKAMQSAVAAKREDIGIARSYLLPKISFEERYLRTNTPGYAFMSKLNQERIEPPDFNPDTLNHPEAINDFQSSITIEQPIFVKKAYVGLTMSRNESQAANEELKRKQEEIAFKVVTACLTISSAKAFVSVASLGVEDAREHLRVADLRYKNDLGQYADVLRATTALTDARQKLNIAHKNVSLARRALGVLLAMMESPDVDGSLPEMTLKDLSFYSQNAETRNDLQAMAFRSENARQNVRRAEAGYFPYLGVGGTYQLNDHNQPFGSEGKSWQVMAFLRWELFDGAKREYERAKARHLETQSREYLAAMKKGISFRIFEAYLNVEEAGKNIELARETLKTAEEGTRLLKLRYENGLSSLGDLLNTQTSVQQARAGLVERLNAHQAAFIALSFESGTILQDLNIDTTVR
jgi:outer membrane protein TolC